MLGAGDMFGDAFRTRSPNSLVSSLATCSPTAGFRNGSCSPSLTRFVSPLFAPSNRRTDGLFFVRSTGSASLRQLQSDRPVGALTDLRGVRGELDGELFGRYGADGSVEVLTDDDPLHTHT
jgi:hypothetical protein